MTQPEPAASLSANRFRAFYILILLVVGLLRLYLAAAMPCLSRDGAKYGWMAQQIEARGVEALRDPEFDQHPLYPLAILAAKNLLTGLGFSHEPLTWQRAGQCVAWMCGLIVVALSGALARRLVERLGLALDARIVALIAMALVGLLDLNAWLSADVMSEQLYLVFFLLAAMLALRLETPAIALAFGLAAGAAYLVRPEAVVLCAAAGAFLAVQTLVGLRRRERAARRVFVRNAALAFCAGTGFVVLVGPYCGWIGGLSPKADKETIERFRAPAASAIWNAHPSAATCPSPCPLPEDGERVLKHTRPQTPRWAALVREDVAWHKAIVLAAYETVRAGRVVLPILALLALWALRRELLRVPLVALTTCMAVHFSLTCVLLWRHGYLHTRHELVLVMLLAPFAAITLAHLVKSVRTQPGRTWVWVLVGACVLTPLRWTLRIPNADDACIPAAAEWLKSNDPAIAGKRLLAGSSTRRVAFYAGMEWQSWPENEPTADARFAGLRARLVEGSAPPAYFAIETGGEERAGNDVLINRLLGEKGLSGRLRSVWRGDCGNGVALHLFELSP